MIEIREWVLALLVLLAIPGVVLGAFFTWVFVEGFRIYFLGKR
jgi:hypothetical protein